MLRTKTKTTKPTNKKQKQKTQRCVGILFGLGLSFPWPCHAACGILVLQPEFHPVLPVVEVQSLNHWTTRELTRFFFFFFIKSLLEEYFLWKQLEKPTRRENWIFHSFLGYWQVNLLLSSLSMLSGHSSCLEEGPVWDMLAEMTHVKKWLTQYPHFART